MEHFRPELGTCPICGTKGSCHVHDYYGRSIIDFHAGKRITANLCVERVYCDSCGHAHAILPDIIIPYTRFSLIFVLHVLADYFTKCNTVERVCEKYDISINLFHKWIKLWHSHKQHWLGMLADLETSSLSFIQYLETRESYSAFSMEFTRRTSFSFLQSHRNPILTNPKKLDTISRYFCRIILLYDHRTDVWLTFSLSLMMISIIEKENVLMAKETDTTKYAAGIAQFRFALIAPVIQGLYPDCFLQLMKLSI